jgi:hypothetical protein
MEEPKSLILEVNSPLAPGEDLRADNCLGGAYYIVDCTQCTHYQVCKYTESKPELPEFDEPFHISLTCDHFCEVVSNAREEIG